ncbi:MAG: hypothetical protein J5859_05655 [Clostridia bacterium]|nr:hypothetical protein [Clostridia bacterium]
MKGKLTQAKTLRMKMRLVKRKTVFAGRRVRAGTREKMRSMGIERARNMLVLPVLLIGIVLAALIRMPGTVKARFRPLDDVSTRPYTGLAVDVHTDPSTVPEYVSLCWWRVTWRELEPEEGIYDFERLSGEIGLERWRERGARLIFRLVLDDPYSGFGTDIPDWLLARSGDVEPYTLGGMTSHTPDYSDPVLQEAHFRLLGAIRSYFGEDIAYVEMGSLGHDGTWTGREGSDSAVPLTDVTQVYIGQYMTAFEGIQVMAVRPYREAVLAGGGLFIPDIGNEDAAWELLGLYLYGGRDEATAADLRPYADYGLSCPVGAWLDIDGDWNRNSLRNLIRQSRLTYICVDSFERMPEGMAEELDSAAGAALWIREAEWAEYARPDFSLYITCIMHNGGEAAFPKDWALTCALLQDGECVYSEETETKASEWRTGDSKLRVRITLPANFRKGTYELAVSVTDGKESMPLGMNCPRRGIWYIIGNVDIR